MLTIQGVSFRACLFHHGGHSQWLLLVLSVDLMLVIGIVVGGLWLVLVCGEHIAWRLFSC